MAVEDDFKKYLLQRRDIFERLANRDWFIECIAAHYVHDFGIFRVDVDVSKRRLGDAFEFWVDDVYRVGKVELDGGEPDHLKRAGYLAYWLRRAAPIIRMTYPEPEGEFKNIEAMREFLVRYGNEFMAFHIGHQLAQSFEIRRVDAVSRQPYQLDFDYIHTVAHFMKSKSVSPHAMYLLYMSLFHGLKMGRILASPPAPGVGVWRRGEDR